MQIAHDTSAETISVLQKRQPEESPVQLPRQLGRTSYLAHDKEVAKTGPVRTEGFGSQAQAGAKPDLLP